MQNYLPTPDVSNDRLLSLVRADVSRLPPATIIAAEIDPLRTDGQIRADWLRAAGVSVRYRLYNGVTHEFFGTGAVVSKTRDAVAFTAEGLRSAFV